VLSLQIPVIAQEQDQYADAQERRAQRSAQVLQRLVVGGALERGVEAEELRDGDAYGREG
jgi:hypothetical protein